MFDMGFTEMMLIGIVALVVIGPERLPGVARTAGKYFARLRNFMMNVRADVESELKADELREMFESQQKELQSLKEVVGDVGKDIGLSDIKDEMSDIASSIDDAKPTTDPEPEAREKSRAKAKPRAKAAAKSKSRIKPVAGSRAAIKTKPSVSPKAKTRAKASVNANTATTRKSGVSKLKPKSAKPDRVKAK
jgi:sec-independent protein translocase protein TatB